MSLIESAHLFLSDSDTHHVLELGARDIVRRHGPGRYWEEITQRTSQRMMNQGRYDRAYSLAATI